MILSVWCRTDYAEQDIPDALVRPFLEHILRNRDWDANMERLGAMVRRMKLGVQEHIDLAAQADLVAAHTLVDQAEAAAAPSAGEVWDHPESAVPVPHGKPRSATARKG
jgi:hypothetical protein